MNRLFFAPLIFALSQISYAQTPWPKIVIDDYHQQCTNSLISQKVKATQAQQFCSCLAGRLSNEFGVEEYQIIRNNQPKPNGSRIERRLYRVMEQCTKEVK